MDLQLNSIYGLDFVKKRFVCVLCRVFRCDSSAPEGNISLRKKPLVIDVHDENFSDVS